MVRLPVPSHVMSTQRVDSLKAGGQTVWSHSTHRGLTGLLPQGWWSDCVEPIHTQTTRRDRCLKTGGQTMLSHSTQRGPDKDRCLKAGGQTMWSHSTQRGPDGTVASRLVVRLSPQKGFGGTETPAGRRERGPVTDPTPSPAAWVHFAIIINVTTLSVAQQDQH